MSVQLTVKQQAEGWRVVKFGEICQEVKATSKNALTEGLEHYIGLEHLDSGSLRIKRRGSIAEDNPSFTKKFSPGHLLFGKRRCYLKKAAIADFEGICSGDIIIMAAKGDQIVPDLLPFIVQSDAFWQWAEQTSSGSLSPRTKFKSLAEWEFPLPAFERQEELLKAFREIEVIAEMRESSLYSAHQLMKTSLKDILKFGRNGTKLQDSVIGKIPVSWSIKQLSELATFQNGKAFPSSEFVKKGEGVHLLKPGNIVPNGLIDWEREDTTKLSEAQWISNPDYQIKGGEIVINLTAQSLDDGFLGRVSMTATDDRCLLNQRIARIDAQNISTEFLFWALQSHYVRKYIHRVPSGTKVKHLYNKEISEIPIAFPNDEVEQEQITYSLRQLQQAITTLETKKAKINSIRTQLWNNIYFR